MLNLWNEMILAPWFPADPGLRCILLTGAFLYGACLGSFLNVCIWRMPRGESVVTGGSHCTSCGKPIRWYDNLPLASYLILRGRCRRCGASFSCRYFVVELLTAVLFTAVVLQFAVTGFPPAALAPSLAMVMLAVASAWIDQEHRIIPDALTFPAMIWGVVCALLWPGIWGVSGRTGALLLALFSGALPAGLLWGFAAVGFRVLRRPVMGLGDVKYLAAAGLLTGIGGAFFALIFGAFAGTVFGVILAFLRRRKLRHTTLAFGPFLAAGSLIWVLWSLPVCRTYFRWAEALAQSIQ